MKLSKFFIFLSLFTAGGAAFAPLPAPAQPQPPVIAAPVEIQEFRGVNTVEVRWEEEYSAEKYHLVLARDRKFKRTAFENRSITGNFFMLENLNYGVYFLRIRSIGDRGKRGEWSEEIAFIVTPPVPTTITGSIP